MCLLRLFWCSYRIDKRYNSQFDELELDKKDYTLTELWTNETITVTEGKIMDKVSAHGVRVFNIS